MDHYLGDGGITVPATTIDDLLRDRGDPDVSLIKIDVQGGEERVIEGAAETLKRTCPALFVEVDGPSLSRSGGSVEILLDRLSGHGYAPYLLRDGNTQEACTADSLKRHIGIQGYSDVLFLPRGWSPPEGFRQSQPRATPVLLFAAFSAVIIAAWYWLNVAQGIGFWWVSSDYPYLSLSHALSIENWFMGSGERVVTPEKKMHPGIPFQFVSWLALRMSALMGPPTSLDGLLIATLQNPETYWRSALLFVLAMTLGGFFLIWRISRPYGWPVTLAACLSCLTLYGFWQYGIMELGNESFALLGAGLFFLTARAAFESKTGSAANWIIFGCVGAAAYLVKLHYIAWSAAVPFGLLVAATTGERTWAQTFRAGVAFAMGFVAVVGLVGGLMIGGDGLLEMFENHLRVLVRSGLYGQGETAVIDTPAVQKSLTYFFANKKFSLALVFVSLGAFMVMVVRWRDTTWAHRHLALGVTLLVGLALSLAAAVKHFNPHYLVVPVVFLPLIILWLGASVGRFTGWILLLPMVLFAGLEARSVFVYYQASALAKVEGLRRDVAAIKELPLGEGEIRIWERTISPGFRAGQVVQFTGIEHFKRVYRDEGRPDLGEKGWQTVNRERLPSKTLKDIPWRYVVFRKRNIKKLTDIPNPYAGVNRKLHVIGDFSIIERLP